MEEDSKAYKKRIKLLLAKRRQEELINVAMQKDLNSLEDGQEGTESDDDDDDVANTHTSLLQKSVDKNARRKVSKMLSKGNTTRSLSASASYGSYARPSDPVISLPVIPEHSETAKVSKRYDRHVMTAPKLCEGGNEFEPPEITSKLPSIRNSVPIAYKKISAKEPSSTSQNNNASSGSIRTKNPKCSTENETSFVKKVKAGWVDVRVGDGVRLNALEKTAVTASSQSNQKTGNEKENENVEPASNFEGRKKKEKLNVKNLVSSASSVYNKQQVPKHMIDNYYNKKSLRNKGRQYILYTIYHVT